MSTDPSVYRRLEALERLLALRQDRMLSTTITAYTPTYLGGTTPGTTTYTAQLGYYVQIGGTIYAWGAVSWSNATGTGNAQISLPLAMLATGFLVPIAVRLNGVTFAGGAFQAYISSGLDYFNLEGVATNAAPTVVAVEVAGSIGFTAIYPAA